MREENQFEMKSFAAGLLKILDISDFNHMSEALFNISISNNSEKLQSLRNYLPDLKRDYLLEVFQYYLADREGKKQDYTPESLSKLVASIAGSVKTVADIAAGSGALSQSVALNNENATIYAEEIDHVAVAFLMINYQLRNKDAVIAEKDALSKSTKKLFVLKSMQSFSHVSEELPILDDSKYDAVVSNPPYNIPYEVFDNGRYPVKLSSSNANFTFIFSGLELLNDSGRAIYILPNEVLTSSHGRSARQYLVDNDLLEAVIMMPAKMFFVTQIPVSILVLSNSKMFPGYVKFVDQREVFEKVVRKQTGEGRVNSQRVYEKEMAAVSDEMIDGITSLLNSTEEFDLPGYAKTVMNDDVRLTDYMLTATRFLTEIKIEDANRKLELIIDDLIRVGKEKTRIKFTINKTSAKELGIDDNLVDLLNQSAKTSDLINQNNKSFGLPEIPNADKKMVTLTASKVLKIEVDIKDGYIPEFIKFLMPSWKQLIYHWNEEEARYLAEYRDALLPLLLSGKMPLNG